MVRVLIAALFVTHGLMHLAFKPTQAGLLSGSFPQGARMLPESAWLVPVAGLLIAGLAVAGVVVPANLTRPTVVIASMLSLLMLAVYHPWPWIGAGLDVVLLAALFWAQSPLAQAAGD